MWEAGMCVGGFGVKGGVGRGRELLRKRESWREDRENNL